MLFLLKQLFQRQHQTLIHAKRSHVTGICNIGFQRRNVDVISYYASKMSIYYYMFNLEDEQMSVLQNHLKYILKVFN